MEQKMRLSNLWKTASVAALLGLGTLAIPQSADAQTRYRYDNYSYSHRECNRFGDCYTVRCDRFGRNCYRSDYDRSGFNNYNYRRGRYYVCDRFNRCAYTPYPRSYYQRYPRAGFSFGFSF
jgi:hypothetical protein